MTQGVRGGRVVDPALATGQLEGHLYRTATRRFGGLAHPLAEGLGAIGPASAGRRKEELWIAMSAPPLAQFGDHARTHGDKAVLAAFAVAHVQAGMVSVAVL